MGIELELLFLLVTLTVGMVTFGRFEVERPIWRGICTILLLLSSSHG